MYCMYDVRICLRLGLSDIMKFDASPTLQHNFTLHSIAMIEIFPYYDDDDDDDEKKSIRICSKYDEKEEERIRCVIVSMKS